jgi:crotonobetainyl-CoA:carnitine CoA-transferase CaiB-like acyl-CoA transferase
MSQPPPSALTGLRVVDLTRVLAGPSCTQTLADHGADVIKVESPQGDETRRWGPPFVEGSAPYYLGLNRNKKGIVLDFEREANRDILATLLEGADVLVENFKPGTLEKWGFGRDALSARYPRLVHCRITGFGESGPYGGLPGYDAAIQATAGLMSINGQVDGEPVRVGVPIVDLVTGLNAVIAVLLALYERERSGRGQFVEVTLLDCALSVLHPHSANYLASGRVPGRSGNAHPNIAPYDTFATRTGPIFLAIGTDAQFRKLCAMLGRPDLSDGPRFATNAARNGNRDALKGELESALAAHEVDALAERLLRDGVPCAPVLNVAQALAHPQVVHRETVWSKDDYRGIGPPVRLERTPARHRMNPPRLGEHTDEVMAALRKRD